MCLKALETFTSKIKGSSLALKHFKSQTDVFLYMMHFFTASLRKRRFLEEDPIKDGHNSYKWRDMTPIIIVTLNTGGIPGNVRLVYGTDPAYKEYEVNEKATLKKVRVYYTGTCSLFPLVLNDTIESACSTVP